MNCGERVYYLRKELLNLTMEAFGERLGVQKSAISKIEKAVVSLSDQMIISICNTNWNGHYVNEQWLRTGEGDVFKQLDVEEEIANLIAQIPNEPKGSFKKRLLSVLARLDEDDWQTLAKIAEELAKEMADE